LFLVFSIASADHRAADTFASAGPNNHIRDEDQRHQQLRTQGPDVHGHLWLWATSAVCVGRGGSKQGDDSVGLARRSGEWPCVMHRRGQRCNRQPVSRGQQQCKARSNLILDHTHYVRLHMCLCRVSTNYSGNPRCSAQAADMQCTDIIARTVVGATKLALPDYSTGR
jgi:hypothetical protein